MNITAMGIVIKEKRRALGLTQKDLAEKLGVSDKTVSKWERCESLPDVSLVPQIALALDVSINCLFGTENTNTARTANITDMHHNDCKQQKAAVLINRINFRYVLAAIVILFSVFFCIFGQITVLGNYISIVPWQYRPLFFSFLIAAFYFIFTMNIKKHRLMLCHGGCCDFEGQLDKVLAAVSVTGVYFIFVFHYIYGYAFGNRLHYLFEIMAKLLGASDVKDGISVQFSFSTVVLCAVVFFLCAVINIAVSEKRKTFGSTVYITSAAVVVMGIIHTIYYGFVGAVIIKNNVYMYGFWLSKPKVTAVIDKINTFNIIYAVLTFAVAALFVFFIREKHSRKVYTLCTVPLWIYQSISVFGFINRNFDGIGSCFAQLNDVSVFLSLAFIAAAPHIAMAVNGLTKPQNQ